MGCLAQVEMSSFGSSFQPFQKAMLVSVCAVENSALNFLAVHNSWRIWSSGH